MVFGWMLFLDFNLAVLVALTVTVGQVGEFEK